MKKLFLLSLTISINTYAMDCTCKDVAEAKAMVTLFIHQLQLANSNKHIQNMGDQCNPHNPHLKFYRNPNQKGLVLECNSLPLPVTIFSPVGAFDELYSGNPWGTKKAFANLMLRLSRFLRSKKCVVPTYWSQENTFYRITNLSKDIQDPKGLEGLEGTHSVVIATYGSTHYDIDLEALSDEPLH